MNKAKKYTGQRLDNGEWVTGELFTWVKFPQTAIICEDHHQRISSGHMVNAFTVEQVH